MKPRRKIALDAGFAFSMCAVAAEKFMKEKSGPDEVATMHAEQNSDTERMIRAVRKSLGDRKTVLDIEEFLPPKGRSYLPITKMINEISFHHKDDAFLLQLADAASLMLRYLIEQRQDCGDLFDAFLANKKAVPTLQRELIMEGGGYNIITFA